MQEWQQTLEQHRADYLLKARAAAVALAAQKGEITINDVRDVCPPPPWIDPRVMGAVFLQRQFECVGYAKSNRKTCHNRPIGRFRLVEAA